MFSVRGELDDICRNLQNTGTYTQYTASHPKVLQSHCYGIFKIMPISFSLLQEWWIAKTTTHCKAMLHCELLMYNIQMEPNQRHSWIYYHISSRCSWIYYHINSMFFNASTHSYFDCMPSISLEEHMILGWECTQNCILIITILLLKQDSNWLLVVHHTKVCSGKRQTSWCNHSSTVTPSVITSLTLFFTLTALTSLTVTGMVFSNRFFSSSTEYYNSSSKWLAVYWPLRRFNLLEISNYFTYHQV